MVPRTELRLLVALLPATWLSDVLDEAPTGAAVIIVPELPAQWTTDLIDDVGSYTDVF